MNLPFALIDAFTGDGLRGNPAGVVLCRHALPDAQLQEIASEVNQAETAFLVQSPTGEWSIRWLTPTVEVDLCGHATLASLCALCAWGRVRPGESVVFQSRSGSLGCRLLAGAGSRGVLDFPEEPAVQTRVPKALASLLGPCEWVGRSRMDWLAVLPSADDVAAFQPPMDEIAQAGMRGLIITAPGSGGVDVVSRFFAPQSGVPEDSVTGSAHCILASHWSPRLGKARLVCRQLSPRGGEVTTTLDAGRVLLEGGARIRVLGELVVQD